jgi:NAD(P)-dependent dehydrogenase (short-subunit alcohol dehydrogenase family)
MGRVSGKVAMITGGAGGLGGSAARRMAEEGAKVVICDVADDQGLALAKELGGEYQRLDVTSEEGWREAVGAVDSRHGRIDILVNGAGIEGDFVNGSPETTSLEQWRKVLAVNLDGTFLGCKHVLPVMKRAGRGSIVNISSMASFLGTPVNVAYGASKAGVQQLTKSVAVHGSRGGMKIRCNSVHPGVIRTRMLDEIYRQIGQVANVSAAEAEQLSLRQVPFGEVGEPDDVAWLVLYLASDEAKYVTGSEFMVDGGWHLVDAR